MISQEWNGELGEVVCSSRLFLLQLLFQMWLTHPSLTLFFPAENTALQAPHVTRGPVLFSLLSLLALCYHLESAPALLFRILRWYCSNAQARKMRAADCDLYCFHQNRYITIMTHFITAESSSPQKSWSLRPHFRDLKGLESENCTLDQKTRYFTSKLRILSLRSQGGEQPPSSTKLKLMEARSWYAQ